MTRHRILALSFFPAYLPPRSGGVERLFRIYSLLSERFDVTLITSGEVGGSLEKVDHGPGFLEVRVPKDSAFIQAYQQLQSFSGEGDLSGPAVGQASKTFGALHDAYLEHYAQADIIIHDSPFLIECDLFRGFDQKVRVYNSYNCETDLYASFHSQKDPTKRIELLVSSLERELCEQADLITVCAEEDGRRFQALFGPIAPIEVVANGVVPALLEDRAEPAVVNRLVFIGSNHKPNVEAAALIVDEIAPANPELEFHLIGSCHPPMRSKNVIAHGYVDAKSKATILRSSAAAINPIATGGGSSLKVAEIGASGIPLISTKLGVRGFDFVADEHFVSLSIDRFSADLGEILTDRERLSRLAVSARAHILGRFSWRSIAMRFGDRLEELAKSKRSVEPYLVLNDYDSLGGVGGGATRTSGLCHGLAEYRPVIFISFADGHLGERRVSEDGRILSILAPKTADHRLAQAREDESHWISSADILNYSFAPHNALLGQLFRCAAGVSAHVICEHPYMVGLPRMYGASFVFSSHNYELGLKRQLLAQHPRAPELIQLVREAEEYCCGASSLIVAVSLEDARQLTAAYRFTAPTIVIRNGSDAPSNVPKAKVVAKKRPSAIFMGSGHGPNVDAARWIIEHLAVAVPEIDIRILGSVSDSIAQALPPNVTRLGTVSEEAKTVELCLADVALNPMQHGSGSNIKIADYLQHGLPVLSTTFGSRGYEDVPTDDLLSVDLRDFGSELSRLAQSATDPMVRAERARRYARTLSMREGGRRLHKAIDANSGQRRRALYVTYRYNDPARGGGEHYVDRLTRSLAAAGWFVDVVAPEAEIIEDVWRFGAFFRGGELQHVAIGQERLRIAKLPIDAPEPAFEDLVLIWKAQPRYEEFFFKALPERPKSATLTWGWGDPHEGRRWCMRGAGLFSPAAADLAIAGHAPCRSWVQLFSDAKELLCESEISGELQLRCRVPAGFIHIVVQHLEPYSPGDARPLGMLVSTVKSDADELVSSNPRESWISVNSSRDQVDALARARRAVRDREDLKLTPLRKASSSLTAFLEDTIGEYDLLITHNAIFASSAEAIAAAERARVPSIIVPHLHLDDDFYHFQDVMEACARASKAMVCPSSTAQFLTDQGLRNVVELTPGIDSAEEFTSKDVAAFRRALGRDGDFFLVLGRKAAAKGYPEIIEAAKKTQSPTPLIVMIGPDDDNRPIVDPNVVYLGPQPREVLRGALQECLALVNMSRSESFGIVLLEAGLASKPVIANRNCAAFSDLVADGSNGFLVTADELPEKLDLLLGDEELRRRLGTAGRKAALTYDWKQIEDRFVSVCNELVEARP